MGIRFLCPECGDKLHVKAFLAGKRGFCPKCKARLEIPIESTIPSTSQASNRGDEAAPAQAQPAQAVVVADDAGAQPVGRLESESVLVKLDMAIPKSGDDRAPVEEHPPGTSPPIEVVESQDNRSDETSHEQGEEGSASEVPVAKVADSVTPVAPHAMQAAGHAAPQIDPISEAPDAVWYVRPPAGGQFGPAGGDLMRRWLEEGRVSADSLVWRDGWEDWQLGVKVFPFLDPTHGAVSTPPPSAPVVDVNDKPSTKAVDYHRQRKKSKTLSLVIIGVLGLMCLLLAVILIVVLSGALQL